MDNINDQIAFSLRSLLNKNLNLSVDATINHAVVMITRVGLYEEVDNYYSQLSDILDV